MSTILPAITDVTSIKLLFHGLLRGLAIDADAIPSSDGTVECSNILPYSAKIAIWCTIRAFL